MSRYVQHGDLPSGATVLAVAAALRNAPCAVWPRGVRLRSWLSVANRLPQPLLRWGEAHLPVGSSHHPRLTQSLATAELAAWNVAQYDGLPAARQFETIVLGPPSGAAAYLCACLDVPFLSHTFALQVRSAGDPDNIFVYQRKGQEWAAPILAHNPDLHVVNLYDPVHRRWLAGRVNQLRLKLLAVPPAYRDFIRRRLLPGGTLLLLNCTQSWAQYTVGERHTFQVGGLGGLREQDYSQGRSFLNAWLEELGSRHRGGWRLPMAWSSQIEGEWGLLPRFGAAVSDFAAQEGLRLRSINGGHVHDFARLALHTWRRHYDAVNLVPMALLVDGFAQVSPSAPRRSPLLPLWLPFNCSDSRDFLAQMTAELSPSLPVLLQPWPSLTPSPDTMRPTAWTRALNGQTGRWLGGDPRYYPADVAALARYTPTLESWLHHYHLPIPRPMTLAEFEVIFSGG